ncbi:J domain-containing protein [Prochlorococcus sp. MIT 1300]|uniref:J domain-containing protein n=1 Tax=Prochlorococcus sp. MIT 1300 TaxID=3096218 RepID=UPI002A75D156|nr:J domain-containing protein [Prochlorococcus sp. MIT 1300]
MSPGGFRDYFNILGVPRGANPDEIKRAFRKMARKYHPDVNPGDLSAEAKFKEVNEAYEVLSDPEKRRRYEQFGQYWKNSGGVGNASGGFDVDFGQYGNFDEFVNDLLGRFSGPMGGPGFGGGFPGSYGFTAGSGFPRSSNQRSLNLDAEARVKISFSEAFTGTKRTLSVNDERVQVQIPKGIQSGSKLRLKGKGNIQPGTGRRGDLYLNIEILPHSIWRLEGSQLRADLPVSLDELALGANLRVITPDGEAEVFVPAGTPPGKSLRLKGKGWPSKLGRGDLFLTLSLQIPDTWSSEEIKLLEGLKKARSHDPREAWLKAARF